MCLKIINDRAQAQPQEVCYKIYRLVRIRKIENSYDLESLYLRYSYLNVKKGTEITSNRLKTKLTPVERGRGIVDLGIHSFVTIDDAMENAETRSILSRASRICVVRLFADRKDRVSLGRWRTFDIDDKTPNVVHSKVVFDEVLKVFKSKSKW